jgi:hypothetical protein
MKAYKESRALAPLTLNLGLGGKWWTPRPGHFTPDKELGYSLNRRLGGPQILARLFG